MADQDSSEDVIKDTTSTVALFSLSIKEMKVMDKEFIKKYESLTMLWDTKHRDYNNKYRRHQSLEVLLNILKKYDSNATIYDVRKKINCMRSSYRKILNKHLSSKETGPNGEECYTFIPTNWKFYALRFLGGDKGFVEGSITNSSTIENNDGVTEDENEESDDSEDLSFNDDHTHESNKRNKSPSPELRLIKKSKKVKQESVCYIDVEEVSDKELKAIATNVVYKLKRMNNEQRCHAELLINKVLLHGLRNNLTYNTDLSETDVLCT